MTTQEERMRPIMSGFDNAKIQQISYKFQRKVIAY